MINILVTAVGRGAGQAVIKALRLSDLEVRIVATDADAWATGLYAADKAFLVPACKDEAYIEKILDICRSEKIDVVIPNIDPELGIFAENRSRFKAMGTEVIISGPKIMHICRNKLATYQFFRERDLPFVETRLVADIFSQPGLEYPLFVKPIAGTGSSEINVLFGPEDLEPYRSKPGPYIAQKYLIPANWDINRADLKRQHIMRHNAPIQKDEISVQHLVSHSGEIISTFMCKSSLKFGTPVHIRPIWDENVYALSRSMVEALIPEGLIGAINLECKSTSEGVFFYEINPRFTTLSAVRAMMGFNECAAVVGDILLKYPLAELRSQLKVDYNAVCSRYVSEIVIRDGNYQRLAEQRILDIETIQSL